MARSAYYTCIEAIGYSFSEVSTYSFHFELLVVGQR